MLDPLKLGKEASAAALPSVLANRVPARPTVPIRKPPTPIRRQAVAASVLSATMPWSEGTISVATTGKSAPKMAAKILGNLAVHADWFGSDGERREGTYTVASLTTGLWIVDGLSEAEARKIAVVLYTTCNNAFSTRSGEVIKRLLPKWIQAWVKTCRAEKRCVDPEPFQKAVR